MPLPIDTLLRVQASPVPAQIVFGACGSMATAPMDCALSLSKTGLNVVPPFEDFQTPPLAAPTYTVSRPSSFTAASAATLPLMAAEPMFRAPSPEIASESNLASCARAFAAKITAEKSTITTTAKQRTRLRISAVSSNYKAEITVVRDETIHGHSCVEESVSGRRRLRPCLRGGQREMCVFQEHVLLDLLDGDLCARCAAFLRLLDGEGVVDSVHLLVVPVIHLGLLQCAANRGLNLEFQFEIRIGIEIVVANVAILHAEFDLEAICPFHRIVPDEFCSVPFSFVVHKRAVEIGVDDQAFHVILRHQLGIFAPAKRRNLPAGFAVIGLDCHESLDDSLLPDLVRALIFLAEFRAKRALADLCRGADAAHGFQLLQSAMRLNIFRDHFVRSLCAGTERKERDGHEY